MADRSIDVATLPLTTTTEIKIRVSYKSIWGQDPRYVLDVYPVTIIRADGQIYILSGDTGKGYRETLETAPRYNAKKLAKLAADPTLLPRAEKYVALIRAESERKAALEAAHKAEELDARGEALLARTAAMLGA